MKNNSGVPAIVICSLFLQFLFAGAANAANSYKSGVVCCRHGCKQITRNNRPVAGKTCVKTTAGFHKTGEGVVGRNSVRYSGHFVCN